jgi:uncharacterized protein YlxW (UPF0749 family)
VNGTITEMTPARSIAQKSRPRSGQRRWTVWVLAVIGAAILAALFGSLVDDHISEDQQFNRLHTTLETTHNRANDEATELSDLRHAVTALRSEVGTDTATWSQDTAELKSAYAAFVITQSDISQQSSRIDALHTCLGGVQRALNALATSDQASAVSALDSVSSSCSTASGT